MNDDKLDKYLSFGKWIVAALVIIIVVPQLKNCCNCPQNAKYKSTSAQPAGTTDETDKVKPTPVNSLEEIPVNEKGIYTTPSKKKRIINHKAAPVEEDPDATSYIFQSDKKYLQAPLLPTFITPKKGNQMCDAAGCPDHCNYDGVKRKEAKTSVSKGQKE